MKKENAPSLVGKFPIIISKKKLLTIKSVPHNLQKEKKRKKKRKSKHFFFFFSPGNPDQRKRKIEMENTEDGLKECITNL